MLKPAASYSTASMVAMPYGGEMASSVRYVLRVYTAAHKQEMHSQEARHQEMRSPSAAAFEGDKGR
jgi:hypothetical protein